MVASAIMTNRKLVPATLLLLCFTLSACDFITDKIQEKVGEKIAEEVLEHASGAEDIDIENGKITIKGKDGKVITAGQNKEGTLSMKSSDGSSATFGGTELPKDFPLPIVEHLKVLHTSDLRAKNKRTRSVMFEAKESDVLVLAKTYEDDLNDKGLEVARNEIGSETGKIIMLSGKNESGSIQAAVQVIASKEKKAINVNLHYVTKELAKKSD